MKKLLKYKMPILLKIFIIIFIFSLIIIFIFVLVNGKSMQLSLPKDVQIFKIDNNYEIYVYNKKCISDCEIDFQGRFLVRNLDNYRVVEINQDIQFGAYIDPSVLNNIFIISYGDDGFHHTDFFSLKNGEFLKNFYTIGEIEAWKDWVIFKESNTKDIYDNYGETGCWGSEILGAYNVKTNEKKNLEISAIPNDSDSYNDGLDIIIDIDYIDNGELHYTIKYFKNSFIESSSESGIIDLENI